MVEVVEIASGQRRSQRLRVGVGGLPRMRLEGLAAQRLSISRHSLLLPSTITLFRVFDLPTSYRA